MVAGNTDNVADEATSNKTYKWVRDTQLYFACQNAFTAPTATKYCQTLFKECPEAKEAVDGKLAVVTGVTIGGAGFHIAEELALSAQMAVILMGRSESKLKDAAAKITENAKKRGVAAPKLYEVLFDLNDLKTAVSAAEQTTKIAKDSFDGKLHVLVNNAGGNVPQYHTTEQGVEANVGRNFLATHLLTEKLLPILRAAASSTYKPRVVHVSSLGCSMGHDFDPNRLLEKPENGGTPNDEEIADGKFTSMAASLLPYPRAKMGMVADSIHLAKTEPTLGTCSLQPGSIVSNFGKSLGMVGTIYYYGFYLFQFSPSQGARAALRGALDPAFNKPGPLNGSFLIASGEALTPIAPTVINPQTKETYTREEYAKTTYENATKLCSKLLAK